MTTLIEQLNTLRIQQRKTMPYLESLEDLDLVCKIGDSQIFGGFTTAKDMLSLGRIGAQATVRRRLYRLIKLGVVQTKRNKGDGRVVELRLSRATLKAFEKLGEELS